MKFYINNKELSEKVFWRTLESLEIGRASCRERV